MKIGLHETFIGNLSYRTSNNFCEIVCGIYRNSIYGPYVNQAFLWINMAENRNIIILVASSAYGNSNISTESVIGHVETAIYSLM
jgi:hypothetical protein